jgi:hypothetical protein
VRRPLTWWVLADGELAGDETYLGEFPSTLRIFWW